ncbi:MAG TPA: hypothetical protein VNL16_02510 [Chloroflexota bacterium]|nr:hypothetical protein [Chloroflexota bacterium]
MKSATFDRFAGWCAILTGVAGFCYAVAFIIIARSDPALGGLLSALFLTLVGLFTSAVMIGVYDRLRETDPYFALWALLLGTIAALASATHGGYDLANAIHPSAAATVSAAADVPSQIDPRGLLTFGVAGVALFVVAWLIRRGGQFPGGLGSLGYLSAILLITLYLARLIVLSPASLIILVPALLNGFIVNPIWYVWLGLALLRRPGEEKV